MSFENITTQEAYDPDHRYGGGQFVEPEPGSQHPMDTPEAMRKHNRLMDWYRQEQERQAVNRYQQALDQDFYDGLQYSEEDAAELIERGQAPLVFNEIKPTLDWLIGTERRTRVDFHVFPREEADVGMAKIKQDVLKYIADINKINFKRSQAFKDAAIVGVGWLEDGVLCDATEDPIYSRAESWRNIWYDSSSIELDLSDARFIFRRKWLDLDIALAMFPDRKEVLEQAAITANLFDRDFDEEFYLGQSLSLQQGGSTFARRTFISDSSNVHNKRSRVELIEAWYRDPARTQILRGQVFNGQEYDPANPMHVKAVHDEACSLYDKLETKVRCAVMTKGHLLQDMESPYRHNRFPFTPIWCYRRGRDNAPYGVVRNIRDPQEDLNKRASKALFILSTNQVIAEDGAVEDWDVLREEVARPDGIIIKNKGRELEIRQDKALAEEHIRLMDRDGNAIRNVGGVTDANLGRDSNAVSGKAIIAQQNQGSVVTAELFDNLRLAVQIQGENLLSLSEQWYAEPKVIRLVGERGKIDWVNINQPQPDGSYLNDITASKADFVVDEQDYRESLRIAMFEQMMNMMAGLPPEVALNLLDLVFEFSDVPGKQEIVARIRNINGQRDPNAEMTPEEQQAQAAQSEAIAKANELNQRMLEAKVLEAEAKVEQVRKTVEKFDAEKVVRMVEAMYAALQAAQVVSTVPGVAPVADEILKGSGFEHAPEGENPQLDQVAPDQVVQPVHDLSNPAKLAGVEHGIHTMRNDGVMGEQDGE